MNDLNAKSLLDEIRKIISLSLLAAIAAYLIVLLERVGGALSAILGAIAICLVMRLLVLAAGRKNEVEVAKINTVDTLKDNLVSGKEGTTSGSFITPIF
jgi:F0F1-type ATP synthase assembly protein I